MPQTIKITRDITAPVNKNVSTDKNRFSPGCKTSKKVTKQTSCGCTIQDIKWYPDEKRLVVEKLNQPDIDINIGDIVGEQTQTTHDIRVNVWDKSKQEYIRKDLPDAKKGTEFTDALQTVVDAISSDTSNIFKVNVTKVVEDVVPQLDIKTKNDITVNVYNPDTSETVLTMVVTKGTEMTQAIQDAVDNDPTIKQDITVKVYDKESSSVKDKVVAHQDTRMTVALQKIVNNESTIRHDITANVYNPTTGNVETTTIVNDNTEITKALQTIVDKLNKWSDWE